MSLVIPASKNYQSPLIATVSRIGRVPPDGPRQVSLEFDWLAMGLTTGAGPTSVTALQVNMSNNATLKFSQIVALKVDNSQCGADVEIIFTDTQDTITIPAYSPNSIFPVFTDSTQFFAVATGALAPDVTRIQALNFMPPPVSLESNDEQLTSATAGGFLSGTSPYQLLPASLSGTLKGFFLSASAPNPPVAVATTSFIIQDGTGTNSLTSLQLNVPAGGTIPYAILIDKEALNWRFKNGVQLIIVSSGWGAVNGVFNAMLNYRTP